MERALDIILVEDAALDAELLKKEFVRSGKRFIMRWAQNRAEYEKELKAGIPDIILSDYALPGFDGMTALKILQKKELDIPFIIVTGSINEETAVACIKAGAQDYVLKDNLARIVYAVDSAIESFKVRREKEIAEQRSRLLIENVGLPVVTVNGEGLIISLNDAAAGFFGGPIRDHAEKNIRELFDPGYADVCLNNIKKVLETGHGVETEDKALIRGEERWMDVNIRPIYSGKAAIESAMLIIRDTTEKMKINRALKDSEERYRKLVEMCSDAIVVHSGGKLTFVNNAGVKMIGASRPEELVGKGILDFVYPDYSRNAKGRVKRLFRERGDTKYFQERLIKLDGTVIDVEVSSSYFILKNKHSAQMIIRDITERKRFDDELRASEERYRAVFESARDIIFVLSQGGEIGSLNPAFEMLCGWQPGDWIGKDFMGLVHPDDVKSVKENVQKCFEKEIPPVCDARLITKGKGCRVFELKLTPLFKNAVVAGVQGIASDITERKYAEMSVRRSRDFYQKLFDRIPNLMWSTDKDGKYIYFNESWLSFRGKTLKEETENGWIKDVHEDDYKDTVEKYLNAFDKRECFSFQFRVKRFDGQYRWVIDSGSPYEDANGDFGGFIGICHDIDDMKNTEEALRLNYKVQTIVNTILQISHEDLSLEDTLGKVLDSLLTMPCIGLRSCGAVYLAERKNGMFDLKAQRNFPEDAKAMCSVVKFDGERCKESFADGRIEFIKDLFDGLAEKGIVIPAKQYCCVPVRSGGMVLGVIVLCFNDNIKCDKRSFEFLSTVANVVAGIVQRKEMENDKKEFQQQFVRSSKLVALGNLAAGIAHEINNPLTIIMGNAQYLLQNPNLDERTKGFVNDINTASQRCKGIVAGLMGFSKQKELKINLCSLNRLIDNVLGLCDNEIKTHLVKVEKEYLNEMPEITASAQHLEQVFLNIVLNAIQSMEGGGLLKIKTGLSRDRQNVEASFLDTGVGISKHDMPKVFDPFFTTKQKGTGLGMAVSYGLVKQHGGEIRVSSEGPGKGTVFTVSLPVRRQEI